MQKLVITLKNYRAFPNNAPVALEIEEGITFLLGVNNVGKSALLRAFFELRPAVNIHTLPIGPNTSKGLSTQLLNTTFDRIAHRSTPTKPIVLEAISENSGWIITIQPGADDSHTNHLKVEIAKVGQPSEELATFLHDLFHKSMYIGAFRSPTAETNGQIYDIKIGRSFVAQWDNWANGNRVDHSNRIDDLTKELRSLFGFDHFSISVSQDNHNLFLTTDDGRFTLEELGDGIAHYVIVLGNAMTRNPSFIFIDEPEIGLHPKMQETFVRTLASKAQYGVVATSHSVGLARSVADKIYTVIREASMKRKCVPYGSVENATVTQSIFELGYSQYAEIGANHLLLVEGRTDIKSFREIFRKFGLDKHFLIWSLNGSEWLRAEPPVVADELNELKRLNARSISVIFDSERTSEEIEMAAHFRPFYDLCRNLGFNTFATDRHSTENYITQEALDDLLPTYKALEPFEVFGSKSPKWNKSKNWLLFQKMNAGDFEGTALKDFIENTLRPLTLE